MGRKWCACRAREKDPRGLRILGGDVTGTIYEHYGGGSVTWDFHGLRASPKIAVDTTGGLAKLALLFNGVYYAAWMAHERS